MYHLKSIFRLGSAAMRWLRRRNARPLRRLTFLEFLPDRVLPSVDIAGTTQHNLSQDLNDPESSQARFMEIPQTGDVLHYAESGVFSLSPQQMSAILGGPSRTEQLGPPVVIQGTIEFGGGMTLPTVELQFGSTVTADLVFGNYGAGSAGETGPAANLEQSSLIGGLVEVNSDGGVRRFLMDYHSGERDGPDGPPPLALSNLPDFLGEANLTRSVAGERPAIGAYGPAATASLDESSSSGPSPFVAGRPRGEQIASGLGAGDDAGSDPNAEFAAYAPGALADVLLTVDVGLPDAKADLVHLRNADLAVVPTYLVGDAPPPSIARSRADDRQDLGLTTHVVGLDEFSDGMNREPCLTHHNSEQRASEGSEAGEIEVGSEPNGATVEHPVVAATDSGWSLLDWLDGGMQQLSGKGAAVVSVLAVEGLVVYVGWRSWRSRRQAAISNPIARI